MSSILRFINLLIPFATPGTPLIQDLLHLTALCALYFFGPQLQEWFTPRSRTNSRQSNEDDLQPEPLGDLPHPPDEQDANDNAPVLQENNNPTDEALDRPAGVNEDGPRAIEPPGVPGPANPARHINDQRHVGTKKAKALARKDQRRAYNEFVRQQGEAQRAEEARLAAEREKDLAPERERRKAAEAALEAKLVKEREERKRREEEERVEGIRRREEVGRIVREEVERKGCCDLWRVAERVGGDVDAEWVEDVVRRGTGLLGRTGDAVTIVTETRWVVRVAREDMAAVYEMAVDEKVGGKEGVVQYDQLARLIESRVCS